MPKMETTVVLIEWVRRKNCGVLLSMHSWGEWPTLGEGSPGKAKISDGGGEVSTKRRCMPPVRVALRIRIGCVEMHLSVVCEG